LRLHQNFYTIAFEPRARYLVSEWVMRPVFSGATMRVDDFRTDPRFAVLNPYERKLVDTGIRSGLLVPMESGGHVIGVLVATSLADHVYGERHLTVFRQVATLIGPFVQGVVLLQRERHRRRRLKALEELTRALGASLNVRDVFARLADAVRPVLDFEIMGVALLTTSGRDVEMRAEIDDVPGSPATPSRIPLEDFSFASRVERGETTTPKSSSTRGPDW
jgi:GAF domain-containing protein